MEVFLVCCETQNECLQTQHYSHDNSQINGHRGEIAFDVPIKREKTTEAGFRFRTVVNEKSHSCVMPHRKSSLHIPQLPTSSHRFVWDTSFFCFEILQRRAFRNGGTTPTSEGPKQKLFWEIHEKSLTTWCSPHISQKQKTLRPRSGRIHQNQTHFSIAGGISAFVYLTASHSFSCFSNLSRNEKQTLLPLGNAKWETTVLDDIQLGRTRNTYLSSRHVMRKYEWDKHGTTPTNTTKREGDFLQIQAAHCLCGLLFSLS